MDENEGESLSTEEKAYFDSRGEAEVKPEVAPKPEPVEETPPAEAENEGETEELVEEPPVDGEPAAPKTVPLAALTKTRQEVKEAKARAADLERQNAILADRWNQALRAQEQQNQPESEAEPEVPGPDDPVARINWIAEQIQNGQRQAKETAAQQEQRQAFERLSNAVNADYSATIKEDPEVVDAHNAMRKSVGEELLAMGYTQEQAIQEINRIENQHLVYVGQNGLKIGPYLKSLAKARGWAPKPAEVPKDPAADLEKLAEAVENSTSLSSAGGGAPKVLDAAAIANMKPDEFEVWLGKPGNQAKFRKLAGG